MREIYLRPAEEVRVIAGPKRPWRGERRCVTVLRLITPEQAHTLGLPAEVPVSVSAYVPEGWRCDTCGATFTPLVYQTGHVTPSQHVHADAGGIYVYSRTDLSIKRNASCSSGCAAFVEPLGQIRLRWHRAGVLAGRASAVRVRALNA